jgi:tRNA U55 pseudouridine synthase TruB
LKLLQRTEAGGFSLADAVALDEVTLEHLRPATDAVTQLASWEVDDATASRVSHGQKLELPPLDVKEDEAIALVRGTDLLAVYRRRQDTLVPDRVLAGDG